MLSVRILFLLFLLPLITQAQENKSYMFKAKVKHGSVLIGGNLNGSISKTTREISQPLGPEEGTNILANLDFKGGYFLANDVAIGLDVALSHESYIVSIEEGKETFRRTYLLAGPFTRYYLDNGIFGEDRKSVV